MSSEEPKPFLSGVMGAIIVVTLTFIVVAGGFVGLLVSGANHEGAGHEGSGDHEASAGHEAPVEHAAQ